MNRWRRSAPSIAGVAVLASLIGGCVRPPVGLRGPVDDVSVAAVQQSGAEGRRVRWGGTIVAVTPRAEETCFEIVSRPLDAAARPRDVDETAGRFVGCAAGFYDPAVYDSGRELTVIGTVEELVEGEIGERSYRFPRVHIDQLYLWPKRGLVVYRPIYDPFWYPYRRPYWGPRPYRRRR